MRAPASPDRAASSPVHAAASPAAPGKSPMAPSGSPLPRTTHEIPMPPAQVTGDALADQDASSSSNSLSFLDPAQRAQIVSDGKDRWLAAEERMHAAVLSVGIREAIRPEDPVPMWVSILIDAAGVGLTVGVGRVMEAARDRGHELLEDADVWVALGAVPTRRQKALMALAQTSKEPFNIAIDLGVSAGKGATDRGAEAIHGKAGEAERDAVLEALDTFHDEAAAVFERIREDVPAESIAAGNDAEILAWFRLARAAGPLTTLNFREIIAAKIARFREADLGEIGQQRSLLGFSHVTQRLQWMHDYFGEGRGALRLAVVDFGADDGCEDDPAGGEFVKWVPEEFVEQAIEISKARGVAVFGEDAVSPPECHADPSPAMGASVVPL